MKERIIEMIKQATKSLDWNKMDEVTALSISTPLGLSRNVVSQYLNELVKDGVLIKIKSRPVYFLHQAQMEEDWGVQLPNRSFKSVADIRNSLQSSTDVSTVSTKEIGFDDLIGANGSLSYCLEQCKSAVVYPGGGLPLLLYGPTGTGKSMFARMMYQYGIAKGTLSADAPFVTLNCSEYANNPELVTANLFGHVKGAYTGAVKDSQGLIAAANGGMLFLDEIHCLRAECQEKLFLFMDQGIYHPLGDNDHWQTSSVRLVFATTESPEEVLLRTLLRRIPIVVHLPALNERPRAEKHKLICFLFREEMEHTGHRISISNAVYSQLMEYVFKGNIGDLKNCIKACCANAFLTGGRDSERLDITMPNLPGYIMHSISSDNQYKEDDNKVYSIDELTTGAEGNRTLSFCRKLVHLYSQSMQKSEPFDEMLHMLLGTAIEHMDIIASDGHTARNSKQHLFTATFEGIAWTVTGKYMLAPRSDMMTSFAIYLYDLYCNSTAYKRLENREEGNVTMFAHTLATKLPKEYNAAREMIELLQNQLNLETGMLTVIVLALVIRSGSREAKLSRSIGIIICHGRSTASSMASAANNILGNYVFDAVDIHPGAAEEALTQLKEKLRVMQGFERLLLLVDIDLSEDIIRDLTCLNQVEIAIINNVSTSLTLGIGERLMQEQNLDTLLRNICDDYKPIWKMVNNRCKQDVVLTVCATGIGAAFKIGELFTDSLPEKLTLKVIPCDYEILRVDGRNAPVFAKYNVQFIIGTLDPQVEEVPFISLDDLSTSYDTGAAIKLLSPYLNHDGIRQFEQNILKSFSLQNLCRYLTILNPDRVLGFVDEAVKCLQEELGIHLQGSTMAGLYLHIGCLVERLIMQDDTLELSDSDRFLDTNRDFARCVKNSFLELEKYYSVEIPLGEIKYIYDYIYADSR